MVFARRIAGACVAALVAAWAAGCVGGPADRQYITDLRYREARRAFERCGSIELTRQALADAHWPRAQANEAIYRIEKEFGLHDTLPSPARIRSEEELKEEEARDQELMRQSGQSFQAMDMNLAP